MTKIVINCCFGGFSLSKEAYDFLGYEWDYYGYLHYHEDFEDMDIKEFRTHPKLIECVEILGKKASGLVLLLVL